MQISFLIALSEIDISGIHLCGHSMGGLVAMELAASNSGSFLKVLPYLIANILFLLAQLF